MLRYHKFTIGNAWMPEYGDPDNASDFEFIYKYIALVSFIFYLTPLSKVFPIQLLLLSDFRLNIT